MISGFFKCLNGAVRITTLLKNLNINFLIQVSR